MKNISNKLLLTLCLSCLPLVGMGQSSAEIKITSEGQILLPGQVAQRGGAVPQARANAKPQSTHLVAHEEQQDRFFAGLLTDIPCKADCSHADCARRSLIKKICSSYGPSCEIPCELQRLVIDTWSDWRKDIIKTNRLKFACLLMCHEEKDHIDKFIARFADCVKNECIKKYTDTSDKRLKMVCCEGLRTEIVNQKIYHDGEMLDNYSVIFRQEKHDLSIVNGHKKALKLLESLRVNEFCLIGYSDGTVRCVFNKFDEPFLMRLSMEQLEYLIDLSQGKVEKDKQENVILSEQQFNVHRTLQTAQRIRIENNCGIVFSNGQNKQRLDVYGQSNKSELDETIQLLHYINVQHIEEADSCVIL